MFPYFYRGVIVEKTFKSIHEHNLKEITIKDRGDGNGWVTTQPINLTLIDESNNEFFIKIPTGIVSNFASIPTFFRGLVQTTKPSQALPAIVHDALVGEYGVAYKKQYNLSWEQCTQIFELLLESMNERGWRRRMLVLAVRFFGIITKRK